MNIAAPIVDRLGADPSAPCLTVTDASGTPVAVYDRAAVLARAGGWAARLRMAGVIPGERVVVFLARDLDLLAVHLACLAAGVTIVPANTSLSDDELGALLEAAQPSVVIADTALALRRENVARAGAVAWWLTGDSDAPAPFESCGALPAAALSACPAAADAPALLLFTSGTTGRPKSVPLSHGNLHANLDALAMVWARTEQDRLLHVLPAHHFHGLVLALYGSLLAGNEIVLMPTFDARAALATIKARTITLLMAVPTMYARMLAAASPDTGLSSLRLAISGSAALSPSVWHAFRERFGLEIVERYGLTETGIVASNPPAAARAGSVGLALLGVDISLQASDAGDASAAEICVRGPSVMSGYGNDPAANRAAFRDGWFRTGDLGRIDTDGYLWIVGRAKELIIVGGSNVIPGEVERALEGVAGVRELAVAGLPDADLGEIVVAYVVCDTPESAPESQPKSLSETAHETLRTDLERAAGAGLAPYKRPRRYLFVDALPRNAMGKVDRARLTRLTNGAA